MGDQSRNFLCTEGLVQRFLSTQELQDTFGSTGSKQRQAMDDFIDNIAQLYIDVLGAVIFFVFVLRDTPAKTRAHCSPRLNL